MSTMTWKRGAHVLGDGWSTRRSWSGLRWLGAWLLVFVAITVWRWEVVLLPPYEDQAAGLWTEADYLAETGFDYHALIHRERHYLGDYQGVRMGDYRGVRSYVISVLPTLLALLMLYCPSGEFLYQSAHLITFAITAGILVLLYAQLRPRIGHLGAGLISVAMLTTPLFATQVDMVGMDIPLTLFVLAAAMLAWRERYVCGAVAGMGAFACKATGGLVTMAAIVYLSGLLLVGRGDSATIRRGRWIGLTANLFALGLQVFLIQAFDESLDIRRETNWPDILRLPFAVVWAPDVAMVLAISLTASLVLSTIWLRSELLNRQALPWPERVRSTLYVGLLRERVLCFSWILILGMLAANWLYIFMPRYFTSAMPALSLIFGCLLYERFFTPRLAHAVVALLVAFNVLNLHGRFFPAIEDMGAETFNVHASLNPRSCMFTERSLGYLDDHHANLEVMRRLERDYADHPVFVSPPQLFYATRPRLGYVTRPLRAYDVINHTVAVAGLKEALLPENDAEIKAPIFIWTGRSRMVVPPPEPGDEVIFRDNQRTPLVVYLKPWGADKPRTDEGLIEWYLDKTWPGDWPKERLRSRAEYLVQYGQADRALRELDAALSVASNDEGFRAILSDLSEYVEGEREQAELRQQGAEYAVHGLMSAFPFVATWDPRLALALRLLIASPDVPGVSEALDFEGEKELAMIEVVCEASRFEDAIVSLRDKEWSRAEALLSAASSDGSEPRHVLLARFARGVLLAQQGRLDEAAAIFETLTVAEPTLPEAHNELGLLHLAGRRLDDAKTHFVRALAITPDFAEAHNNLGVALMRMNEPEKAAEHFTEAVRLAPELPAAQHNLAVAQRSIRRP